MTILSSLLELHDALAADGEMPRAGFAEQTVVGEIVIDLEGRLIAIQSLMAADGNQTLRPRMSLPAVLSSRTSGIAAQFMWDNTSYVLGVSAKKEGKGAKAKPVLDEQGKMFPEVTDRTLKQFAAFVGDMSARLDGVEDAGIRALLTFLQDWQPATFAEAGHDTDLLDGNLVFRVDGETEYLHERSAVSEILSPVEDPGEDPWTCLVTGDATVPTLTHPPIKGVIGAQSSGASLVSFNSEVFSSHGKKQGQNAPICGKASAAISNVLNYLLRQRERGAGCRTILVGGMTFVFWVRSAEGEERAEIESMASWLLGGINAETEDPNDVQARISRRMSTFWEGAGAIEDVRVCILGILPNAGRLSIKYWSDQSASEVLGRFADFQKHLEIISGPQPISNTIWSLTRETAMGGDAKRIQPNLPEALMRSILSGGKLPSNLLTSILKRVHVERKINARRAAICKAYLAKNEGDTFTVSLDETNTSVAYLLGRAMRIHEEIQKKANPNTNMTVADRYMAAAMATPARVFSAMGRGTKHSLSKIRRVDGPGLAEFMDRRLADILSSIQGDIPVRLGTADQARFTLGYYHQKCHRHDAGVAKSQDNEGQDQ